MSALPTAGGLTSERRTERRRRCIVASIWVLQHIHYKTDHAPLFTHPPSTTTAFINSLGASRDALFANSVQRAQRHSHFQCTRVWGFQPLSTHLSRIICIMTSEQEKNRQRVKQLVRKPGNGNCADCGAAGRLAGHLPAHAGHISETFPHLNLFVSYILWPSYLVGFHKLLTGFIYRNVTACFQLSFARVCKVDELLLSDSHGEVWPWLFNIKTVDIMKILIQESNRFPNYHNGRANK